MGNVVLRRSVLCPIVLMLCLSISGCFFWRRNIVVGKYDCSSLEESGIYRFQRPKKDRVAEFKRFDFEKQYAIFICGRQYTYSYAYEFDEPFALVAGKAIGFIKARLMEARDDQTVRDLILLFWEMQRVGSYDVAGDEELMRYAQERVEGMKYERWKRLSEEYLKDIRESQTKAGNDRP